MTDDYRGRQQCDKAHGGSTDVEGDGKSKRDKENRTKEGIRDSVGAIFDNSHQVRVRDLVFKEQASQIGTEDNVQANGLGEQAKGKRHQQYEGEAFTALGTKRQSQTRIDESPHQDRNGDETDYLADRDNDTQRFEFSAR